MIVSISETLVSLGLKACNFKGKMVDLLFFYFFEFSLSFALAFTFCFKFGQIYYLHTWQYMLHINIKLLWVLSTNRAMFFSRGINLFLAHFSGSFSWFMVDLSNTHLGLVPFSTLWNIAINGHHIYPIFTLSWIRWPLPCILQ